jgi:6-phosphogluconolactonase/glucosamine-6-phosphate isomerase/deaminase
MVTYGAAKAEILRDVLQSDVEPRRLPSQLARRAGATWIVDRAAASRL